MSRQNTQRQSQLITTFGPGAMVDLPTRSVLVGGLDDWKMSVAGGDAIDEPVLARLMERWLRERGRLEEGTAIRLLTPPAIVGERQGRPTHIDVTIFPAWFVCQRMESARIGGIERRGRRLVPWDDLDASGRHRQFVHDDGKKDDVTPVRFVGACTNGHLQDINWRQQLHNGTRCHEPMWLTDRGTSGLLADLEVVCACGAIPVSVQELTKPGKLGFCNGRMPWISAEKREECNTDGRQTHLRLLTRSATNTYFSQTISVISLPKEEDELSAILTTHRASLAEIESIEDMRQARKFNASLKLALQGYSDEIVFERLQLMGSKKDDGHLINPRVREFDVLAGGQDEIGNNATDTRLYARTLPPDAWRGTSYDPCISAIDSVVAVDRLREVMCIYGFTRLEPAPSASDGHMEEIKLAVGGAPIAENHEWLPAIEQFGEGIFIRFEEDAIKTWLNKDAVKNRVDTLVRGYRAHQKKYQNPTGNEFPGAAYILLHSLAHALITEIALECGYPVSSLKERIYAFQPGSGEQGARAARYGILVYAVALGSGGTLGGLVQTVDQLSSIFRKAIDRLAVCSNDPVCADHDPISEVSDRSLIGSACHGCLLIPETSCERRNTFLDRSLLIETMAGHGGGFCF